MKLVPLVASVAVAVLSASIGHAAPVLTSPAPSPLASGVNSHWVDVTTSPHSIDQAIDALAGAGGFTIAQTVDQVLSVVDIGDCCGAGTLDPLSALGDDNFAVRYTGYLRIASRGNYTFRMYHDDGIRVRLGGETVIDFATDTGARDTYSTVYDLEAGYYALEITGWEQGGLFVNQFFIGNANGGFALADDLWHQTSVPEPASLALVGLALAGVGLSRSRRS